MTNAAVSEAGTGAVPSVGELLAVDREFRAVASRQPVLHVQRGERRFAALYSTSSLARRLGRTNDWVVIDLETPGPNPRWTVVTERLGVLKGARVVRGREVECFRFYHERGRHAAA